MALSTSCLDRARLRDLLDGALPDDEQAELTHHLDRCASFVLSEDGTLTWWELATGEERGQLKVRGELQGGSVQPTGRTLATAAPDGVVRIWDLTTGKQLAQSLGHSGKVWQLAFSPD